MPFWPDDIDDKKVLLPAEVMINAGEELERRVRSLSVSISQSELEDRVVLGFIIVHKLYDRSLRLFEVAHAKQEFYPLVIIPIETKTPDFLKKKKYVSGVSTYRYLRQMSEGTPGRYVENPWVCATPAEFNEKLVELFAMDAIKGKVISLLAPPIVHSEAGEVDHLEDASNLDDEIAGDENQESEETQFGSDE